MADTTKTKSRTALIAIAVTVIMNVAAQFVPAVQEFQAELTGQVCAPVSTESEAAE